MSPELPRYGAAAAPVDPSHVARAVLSQDRFRVLVAGPVRRTWWDAVREWIGDRWHELVRALFHNVHFGSRGSAAFGDALLVALVALIVIVAARLLWSSARIGQSQKDARAAASVRDARMLYAQSVAAAQRGDFAHAILRLFDAAVTALDMRGVVPNDPSQTVNECRRQIREKAPALAEAFDAVAKPFTAVLYADEPVSETQWNSAREAYERWIDADA